MSAFVRSRKRPRCSTKAIVDTDDETTSSSSSSSIELALTNKKHKTLTLSKSFLRNTSLLGNKKQLLNDDDSSDDDMMGETYSKRREPSASKRCRAENTKKTSENDFSDHGDSSSVDTTELARQLQAPLEKRGNPVATRQRSRSIPPVKEAVIRGGNELPQSYERNDRENITRRYAFDSAAVTKDEPQENEHVDVDDASSVDTAELARQLRGENAPSDVTKTQTPARSKAISKSTTKVAPPSVCGTDDFELPEQDESSLSSEEEAIDERLGSVERQNPPPSRILVPQKTASSSRTVHLMHSSQPVDTAAAARTGPSSEIPVQQSGPQIDSTPLFRPTNGRQVQSEASRKRPPELAQNSAAARHGKATNQGVQSLFVETVKKRYPTYGPANSHGEISESRSPFAGQHTQALADSVLQEAAFFDNDCSQGNHALPRKAQEPEVVDLAYDSEEDDGKAYNTTTPSNTVFVREGLRSVKKSPAFLQSPQYDLALDGVHNHDGWEREHCSPSLQNQQDGLAEDIQGFSDDENDDGNFQQFGRRASGALARREQLLATQDASAEDNGAADFLHGSAAPDMATASGLQSPWGQTTTGRRRRLRNATTSNTSFARGVILRNGDQRTTTTNPSTYAPPSQPSAPVDTWNQQYTAAVAGTGHSWNQPETNAARLLPRNDLAGGSVTGAFQFTNHSENYEHYDDNEESTWTRRPAGRGRGTKKGGGRNRKGGWGRRGRGRGRGRGGARAGRGRSRGGARGNNNRSFSNTGWSASDDPNLRHVGGAEMSF